MINDNIFDLKPVFKFRMPRAFKMFMLTAEEILVEQKAKSLQTDGRALDRRFDQNGLGSGHVCGRIPLSTGGHKGSWFFGVANVH